MIEIESRAPMRWGSLRENASQSLHSIESQDGVVTLANGSVGSLGGIALDSSFR